MLYNEYCLLFIECCAVCTVTFTLCSILPTCSLVYLAQTHNVYMLTILLTVFCSMSVMYCQMCSVVEYFVIVQVHGYKLGVCPHALVHFRLRYCSIHSK